MKYNNDKIAKINLIYLFGLVYIFLIIKDIYLFFE